METIKIKTIAEYNGHSIRPNKNVNIAFKCEYGELTNYIKLIQLLNENIEIMVKIQNSKPIKLGTFMLSEIKVGNDGQGIIKFNSQLDYVEKASLNQLSGEILNLLFKADIENEDEGGEDNV